MTWQDVIINKLYEYYKKDESKTKENWVTNPQLHAFVRKSFIKKFYFDPEDADDSLGHFEFLRHIMYTICNYIKNNEYLIFIARILITILEEVNAISKQHVIRGNTKIYNLVVLPELVYYFRDDADGIMKLSNARVKAFIEAILDGEIDRTICVQMEPIINTRTTYSANYSARNKFGKGYKPRKPRKTKPKPRKTKPRKTKPRKPKPRKTKKK